MMTMLSSIRHLWVVQRHSRLLAVAGMAIMLSTSVSWASTPIMDEPESHGTQAAQIIAIARRAVAENHLRSVILRVTVDGRNVVTKAMGLSADNRPATTDMHLRNGAVAIAYIATLLLQLVDEKVVTLDAPLSKWLPELPDSDRVTLRMLATMTAGYPDYVQNAEFVRENAANVFRQWTPQELIDLGLSTRRIFDPGTNWDYSHTNYVILGRALERITGTPMAMLMRQKILRPLQLRNTRDSSTSAIQKPVLHAFSSERREALGIPPSEGFYEESTYWNPSWTLAEGAIQTTDIYDMAATAEAIGTGALLSSESHGEQIAPKLIGFGHEQDGCPACHTLDAVYSYGVGVVITGQWILQNPLFGGYGSLEAYLPSKKIAVAVAVTFGEGAFDARGEYLNGRAARAIFGDIAALMTGEALPQ
jgi:CubicO group peptidase (beta-lactamase class C family)